jgi:heme-degrading monooxygenase HmoA
MYARVASFEQINPSAIDEMIGRIRERIDAGQPPAGAKGGLMLIDRQRSTSLGITFFDSEEAIDEAEPEFDRMGEEIPEEIRGRRTSVETYEVVVADGGEGAKAARVSTLEGSPETLDEGIRHLTETTLPPLRQIGGFKGIVGLGDRSSGRVKVVTLWETEQALTASEEQANRLREEAAEGGDSRIAGVDRYEVAIAQVPAVTTV